MAGTTGHDLPSLPRSRISFAGCRANVYGLSHLRADAQANLPRYTEVIVLIGFADAKRYVPYIIPSMWYLHEHEHEAVALRQALRNFVYLLCGDRRIRRLQPVHEVVRPEQHEGAKQQ